MASCPSPRPRSAPPGRADSVRASPTPHPHSAPPRRADSTRASPPPHPRSAPHSAARTSQPRRADSVRASPTPHPHSAPPRRADSARASLSPHPRSAPHSAVRASQPGRAESASSSPPPHPDSVRVYAVRDSDLEFVAELGRTDEAHHAVEVRDQAPAQSQALSEVLLVFCSKGSIVGLANLFPDAPRFGQLLSDDHDRGDEDEEEEEGEQETDADDLEGQEDTDDDDDGERNAGADDAEDDDDDEDGDGSTFTGIAHLLSGATSQHQHVSDDDEEEEDDDDEEENGSSCTDATSQHQRVSDDEESDDDDEEKEDAADEEEEEDDDDEEDDGSSCTATDDSSNNVSSNEEGDDDEDEAAYDWDENAAEKQEMECGPAYFLKLRVWPSSGYANIVLFGGIKWISTQNYTLSCLSSTEAEITVEKLSDVSQIDMQLALNAVLLRSEYEGTMVNSAAAEAFVKFKLMPSLYHFNVDHILGEGAFCNVRLCTSGDKDYAVKIIKSEDLIDLDEPREVAIHSTLRSPHVVKFLNAWTESHIPVSYKELSQSDDSRESGEAPRDMQRTRYILILMELCQKSLADYLSSESRELDAEESLHIFKEILLGVQYVHGQNVIHRDLKPSNVFLGKDNKFKLGDFGQSRVQPRYIVSFKATPNLGTIFYEAPELKKGERISDKVDIYPLGVMYLELLKIFKTAMNKDKTFKILRDGDGSKISWEGDLCLFKQLIAFDPVKRPSVNDILEHISRVISAESRSKLCRP